MDIQQESLKFLRGQLKRAQINIDNAKKRGDSLAVSNLERKIHIYLYIIGIINGEVN